MGSERIKRCVLAVDSGGTKCDVLLVRDDGTVIGRGYCDYADPTSGRSAAGSGRSGETVGSAIERAMGNARIDELYVGGRSGLKPTLFENCDQIREVRMRRMLEWEAAFALTGKQTGVVVQSGTGAFVYARSRDGKELHLDGRGPAVGDYGSAYQIGAMAVRAAARSKWHPRHATSLEESIPLACGLGDGAKGGLVRYTYHADRAEIAALAKVVDADANAGDRIARSILETAAGEIVETIRDVVDRMGLATQRYPMIGTGSVATGSKIYWDHVCRLVREFAPELEPVLLDKPPVVGLALVLLQTLDVEDPAAVREKLLRTFEERGYQSG